MTHAHDRTVRKAPGTRKRSSAPRAAAEYKELLRAGRWFSSIEDEIQDTLLAMATLRRLAAGEELFSHGDPPNGLFAVVSGALRIIGPTGEPGLLTLVEPPMWFGEISVLDGLPHRHSVVAAMPSMVVHVPVEPLFALLEAEPRHWRTLGRLSASKARLAFESLDEITRLSLYGLLARRLLVLAQRHGEWTDRSSRTIRIGQESLALMIAASRQTTNRLLKKLEAHGMVRVTYGAIEIVDLDKLRATAS